MCRVVGILSVCDNGSDAIDRLIVNLDDGMMLHLSRYNADLGEQASEDCRRRERRLVESHPAVNGMDLGEYL